MAASCYVTSAGTIGRFLLILGSDDEPHRAHAVRGPLLHVQCLFQASFFGGGIPPQKNLTVCPKRLPNCVLKMLFFGRDNKLRIYHIH